MWNMSNLDNLGDEKNNNSIFSLNSDFVPTGDQPKDISELITGIKNNENSINY